jgi:hypothetical protein
MSAKATEWRDAETGKRHVFQTTDDCLAFFRARSAACDPRIRGYQPAPAIRPDAIEMFNPVTGGVATSKSRYYQEVRQAGCEINPEAGIRETNRPEFKSRSLAEDIKRAIENPDR